jgi:hypothetical protein
MAAKNKLFSLKVEDADAELIDRVDAVEGECYINLRLRLEDYGVVD